MSWTSARIFRDPELNRRFLREGYAVTPLLATDDIAQLRDLYFTLGPDPNNRLNVEFTINFSDDDIRYRMNRGIHRVMAPKLETLLNDYSLMGCNFVAKLPGRPEMALHQDNSLVDELNHVSLNVWCPLLDVDEQNGCLTVVPQSHRWSEQFRAHGDWLDRSPFADVRDVLDEPRFKKANPMPAGHALFYHSRTMHGSMPNSTADIRLVTLSGLLPKGMAVRYVHRLDETKAEVFDADETFYWRELFFAQRPSDTPSLGVFDLPRAEPLTKQQFLRLADETAAAPFP